MTNSATNGKLAPTEPMFSSNSTANPGTCLSTDPRSVPPLSPNLLPPPPMVQAAWTSPPPTTKSTTSGLKPPELLATQKSQSTLNSDTLKVPSATAASMSPQDNAQSFSSSPSATPWEDRSEDTLSPSEVKTTNTTFSTIRTSATTRNATGTHGTDTAKLA